MGADECRSPAFASRLGADEVRTNAFGDRLLRLERGVDAGLFLLREREPLRLSEVVGFLFGLCDVGNRLERTSDSTGRLRGR